MRYVFVLFWVSYLLLYQVVVNLRLLVRYGSKYNKIPLILRKIVFFVKKITIFAEERDMNSDKIFRQLNVC